jgi:dethiobiotin synthetase
VTRLRGLFITGTDTGVGKTVLAGAIVAALRAGGEQVTALKPVITGLDERQPDDWPADHELLARTSGASPGEVALLGYGPAVSPHFAAELAGRPIDGGALVTAIRAAVPDRNLAVVEGVGGLLVPLSDSFSVRDLAIELELPLVVAARSGLGTINHTLLTLEVARAAGLTVAGVVLTPWRSEPDQIERSNRDTLARLGEVDVSILPELACAETEQLARAGAALPVERWLTAGR